MSAGKELWELILTRLKATPEVMALVGDIFDKVPANVWQKHKAFISRGPFSAVDDGADCLDGQEFTIQIDIWVQKPSRWACDDIVGAVRKALHGVDLALPDESAFGLTTLHVVLTRVLDDPDPQITHGVVQVRAFIEQTLD